MQTTEIQKLAAAAALGSRRKKKQKEPGFGELAAPSTWLAGLGAAGAGGLGTAYGLGSDKQIQRVIDAANSYDPAVFTEGKLPPNQTGLTYYQKMLSPGAQLKPFGIPVGELLVKLRSDPSVMSKLKTESYSLPTRDIQQGGGGLAHYNMFAQGPVPAYAHQLKARLHGLEVPTSFGVPSGTRYSDWMGRKFEDFIADRTGVWSEKELDNTDMLRKWMPMVSRQLAGEQQTLQSEIADLQSKLPSVTEPAKLNAMKQRLDAANSEMQAKADKLKSLATKNMGVMKEEMAARFEKRRTNPFEFTPALRDNEEQAALMEDFFKSLPPEVQKYRIEAENPGPGYAAQTGNYLPKARAYADFRNQLKNTGITAGGAAIGGGITNAIYNALVGKKKRSHLGQWVSALLGTGLGGAGAYLLGTDPGRAISTEWLKPLLAGLKKEELPAGAK